MNSFRLHQRKKDECFVAITEKNTIALKRMRQNRLSCFSFLITKMDKNGIYWNMELLRIQNIFFCRINHFISVCNFVSIMGTWQCYFNPECIRPVVALQSNSLIAKLSDSHGSAMAFIDSHNCFNFKIHCKIKKYQPQ